MPRPRLLLVVMSLLVAIPAAAETVQTILDDVYYGPNSEQYNARTDLDVVGYAKFFDIDKVVFTELSRNAITVEIWMNYHAGDETLSPFMIGAPGCDPATPICVELSVGDLLFDVIVGDQTVYRWGVPLRDHDGLNRGVLYQLNDNGFRTSNFYMSADWFGYKPLRPVTIDPAKVRTDITPGANLAYSSADVPGTLYETVTTMSFATGGTTMWDELLTNGELSVHFASAVCANDVLDGILNAPLVPNPEPDTLLLLGAGLLLAIGIGRKVERT